MLSLVILFFKNIYWNVDIHNIDAILKDYTGLGKYDFVPHLRMKDRQELLTSDQWILCFLRALGEPLSRELMLLGPGNCRAPGNAEEMACERALKCEQVFRLERQGRWGIQQDCSAAAPLSALEAHTVAHLSCFLRQRTVSSIATQRMTDSCSSL